MGIHGKIRKMKRPENFWDLKLGCWFVGVDDNLTGALHDL